MNDPRYVKQYITDILEREASTENKKELFELNRNSERIPRGSYWSEAEIPLCGATGLASESEIR